MLIKLEKNQDGEQLVSARELHQKLESNERFSKWFERMVSYGFEENIDYTPYQNVHPQNKQEIQDYVLKLDMAKEISMLQRSEKGKEVRRYFIEKEKEYIQLLKGKIKKYKKILDLKYGKNLINPQNLKETQAHYYMEPFLELVNLVMEVA